MKLLLETLPERYRIQTAPNGREALEFVRAHDADLILLDVMMPEMDGIETYAQSSRSPSRSRPPFFFSRPGRPQRHHRGAEAGRRTITSKNPSIRRSFAESPDRACRKWPNSAHVLHRHADPGLRRTLFSGKALGGLLRGRPLRALVRAAVHRSDRFKAVNDTYGHLVGDEYLRFAAKLMKAFFRQSDTVARYGGDEFCVLLPEAGAEQAALVVARLKEYFLQKRFKTGGVDLAVGLSVGFSVFGPKADTPQALIQEADAAMYRTSNPAARSRVHSPDGKTR